MLNRAVLLAGLLCLFAPALALAKAPRAQITDGRTMVLETNKAVAQAILDAVCAAPPDEPPAQTDALAAPAAARVNAAGLPTDCNTPSAYAYRSRTPGLFFVIDDAVPSFTEVRKTPSGFFATRSWSLADLPLQDPYPEASETPNLRIANQLLPTTEGDRYTIVLELERREMYSGGGGHWTTGWIVSLRDTEPRVIDRYGALPWSCSITVRACYTERDYQTSKRCTEETSGGVDLLRTGAHPWRMRWTLDHYPYNSNRSKHLKQLLQFKLDGAGRFALVTDVKICGEGPQ